MLENIVVGVLVGVYSGLIVLRWSMFYQTKRRLMNIMANFCYIGDNSRVESLDLPNQKEVLQIALEFMYLGHLKANEKANILRIDILDLGHKYKMGLDKLTMIEISNFDNKWQKTACEISPDYITLGVMDSRLIKRQLDKIKHIFKRYNP